LARFGKLSVCPPIRRLSLIAARPYSPTLPFGEGSLPCLLFTASEGPHTLAVEVHQAGATRSRP